ncbi:MULTISPECIES: hypothetical protein [Roseobacteraceae]|uniref:Polysaccharide biosynthesis protein n=3 Tax=Roseobacteraceae TaxID=2854170 RepID=A0A0U1NNM3_9RHOB|nr:MULTISPECIES: hypothetical protein [Roseobacteraceae]CRK76331.1 Polysaccharide biosynthesis protein [Nereida ignava]CUH61446.1 Polysaccharide biosynthesis protein [Thalassobacter stenotrophicus]SFJ79785.1 Membrane protein involved in the export of O-antigen and teichoic acid [Nereida ignava DSM 16309]SHJ09619.1 Membrane protein involved in the export of O-antigen and teichoic acid [Thalassobacter stenotrophicus DSM 16310]
MLTRNAMRLAVGELGSRLPLLLLEVTLARLLGPAVYGIWSIIQTFATYGNFLHFGVSSSMARREPGLIELGSPNEVLANRAAAYGFQIMVIVVVAGLLVAISGVRDDAFDEIGGLSTALALLVVILAQQFTISTQASALNEYKVIASSIARLVYAFAFLAIGLVVIRFEPPLLWLTLGWAVALALALIMLNVIARGIVVFPRLDYPRTISMLRDGFPIMVQGLLRFGLMSVDKIAVFWVARPEAVGFYGIGALAASVTGLPGSIIARVSLPTHLRLRERTNGPALMQAEFDRMLVLIQLLTYGALFTVCAFSPLLIHFVLPEYEPAVRVIGILAITGGVTGLAQAMSDVTMSLGIKAAVLVNTVITLLLEILFLGVAWNIGGGIEGMAASVLVAMILMSGRSVWLCMRAVGFACDVARRRLVTLAGLATVVMVVSLGVLELQMICMAYLESDARPAIVVNVLLSLVTGLGLIIASKRFSERSQEDEIAR